jgi:hypothetical protein
MLLKRGEHVTAAEAAKESLRLRPNAPQTKSLLEFALHPA